MQQQIQNLIIESLKKNDFPLESVEITIPTTSHFGDFSTNIAMKLAKKINQSPLIIGAKIIEHIPENTIIKQTDIVAPGFINITVFDHVLIKNFIQKKEVVSIGSGKTVITDSSNPNIAKPMGIHHLLSTIIGDSINRIFQYCGYTVIRDNFIGDFGTQFGKVIYAYKQWGNASTVEQDPIPELLKLYIRFHEEVEKDVAIEDEARHEFKKLEDKDPENIRLWRWIVDISLKSIHQLYTRLGVSYDIMHGESFYEDKMTSVVQHGIDMGYFVEGEKGALIMQFPENNLPVCVIRKSDGASMYHTRDLARIAYWDKTYHPDIMINVVDVAQELYFRQLFSMTELLKLTKAKNIHVSFGRMQFKDRQMSTRKGNIILLENVLDEAIAKSKDMLKEKNVEFPAEEQESLAVTIGLGAIRYAILSQNRNTNIVFDWDKIISLEGNSGPYLQYTYSRGKSILQKCQETIEPISPLISLEIHERVLMKHMLQFHSVIIDSCETCKPNLIANYLYELAQRFNSFYNAVPVLQAEPEKKNLRLKLVESSCTILQAGLQLLGIDVPERM